MRRNICFSHVAALAKVLNCCNGVVNSNILKGEIILFDKIIDARGPRRFFLLLFYNNTSYKKKEKKYIYSTLPCLHFLQKYTVHYTKT